MKLLLVQTQFPPETDFGGIATYGWFAAHAYALAGHEVTVIAETRNEQLPPPLVISKNITVHRVPGRSQTGIKLLDKLKSGKDKSFSQNAFSLFKQLHKDGYTPDIIEAADYRACAFAFLEAKLSIPVIVTCHSPAFLVDFFNDERAPKRAVHEREQHTIKQAAAVQAPSKRIANMLSSMVQRPLTQFFINPYPYPVELELQRHQEALDIHLPFVLFVGRIERRKGIFTLLKAWRKFNKHQNYTLVCAGKLTHHYPEAQSMADEIPDAKIQFTDTVSRDQLAWLYRNASLVVLPSEPFDNYPFTCLESMGFAAPTLVSDSGGMSELIDDGENGWIFRHGDEAHLVERMEEIHALGNAERTVVAHRGQETILKNNDPQRFVKRTIKFYEHILER